MAIRRITTVPIWEERAAKEDELLLKINIGTKGAIAFGFGSHPTTSVSLSLLAGLYGERAPRPRRVLDVGCGTGVLSVACARLGADEVVGVDIDPNAIPLATENAARNGVADRCRFESTPIAAIPGRYDLVVANLPSPMVVRELAAELCAKAKGGFLITSGFIEPKSGPVLEELQARGRKLIAKVERGDERWCGLLLKDAGP